MKTSRRLTRANEKHGQLVFVYFPSHRPSGNLPTSYMKDNLITEVEDPKNRTSAAQV